MLKTVLEVLDYPETDHKGNIAVIVVHFTLIQKSAHTYMYIVRMVLALNESIWFAAEGFFIDSEHYTIKWKDLQSINENNKGTIL